MFGVKSDLPSICQDAQDAQNPGVGLLSNLVSELGGESEGATHSGFARQDSWGWHEYGSGLR
jgi:hypothetical protein